MRQDEKERKKILFWNSVHPQLGEENSEKNSKKIEKIKKPLFIFSFSQNGMRQTEKEGIKILVRNSVHTRPVEENSEKNSKKIEKTKKPHSCIIFSQNGTRQAEKERKKFKSRIPFVPNPGKKIPKKQQNNSKNQKT